MNYKNILIAVLVAVGIVFIGAIFIENAMLNYTDSAILYLSAVIGAGCYWIGSNLKK